MSTDVEYPVVEDPVRQSAASLVGGILGDLQHLVEQQFQLTRREIEDEFRRRAAAGAVFGAGIGVIFLGVVVLCLTLVHLLHSIGSPPAADVAWLPLWACHAVVAGGLVVVGGILALVGRARFRSIASFQNPVTEILQEPAQWTTPPK